MKKKTIIIKAFTLAEVLITLTIIGVIAALTIPNLMKKNFEAEAVARAKQTYAQISNVWKKYQAIHNCDGADCMTNPTSNWCNTDIENIILENIKVKEHYIYTNGNKNNMNNYLPEEVKGVNGERFSTGKIQWARCHFVLDNGITMNIQRIADWTQQEGTTYKSLNIIFDINGKKGPNQIGADTFIIGIPHTTGQVLPGPVGTVALGGDYNRHGECYYMMNQSVRCPSESGSKPYLPERVPLQYILQNSKLPDLSKLMQ